MITKSKDFTVDQSKLRIYSIGRVAINKEMSSNEIEVTPIEFVPMMDGEIEYKPEDLYSKGLDHLGKEYQVKVSIDQTITAEWFSLSTNRITSPDVRRGEQVLIYQYGDTDKYYWTSMGRNDNLRRLETVIYAWSDESDNGKDIELNIDNCYTLEVSTHKKHITLKTSKNDKEDFLYTIQVDAKNSHVTITDDKDNYIQLNSKDTVIECHNHDGTWTKLDKMNLTAFAPDSLTYTVANMMTFKAGVAILFDVPLVTFTGDTITTGNAHAGSRSGAPI